jgi:hypothetical protein
MNTIEEHQMLIRSISQLNSVLFTLKTTQDEDTDETDKVKNHLLTLVDKLAALHAD